jgi:hypothetical protein
MAGERNVSEEIWKPINGFINYEISSKGRVRNKETHYIIAQLLSSSGYMTVRLRRHRGDEEKPCLNIHRLVAEAFIPGGSSELQVNHIDGNKLHNNVENLEWCTRKENAQHAMRMGLFNPKAPEPPKRKVRILETGEIFDSIRDCAKVLNVKEQHVWACLNGQRHTRNGLHFEYIDDKTMEITKRQANSILYDFQYDAVNKAFNGCIFNGGTGTGKSRTGLYFYFKTQGGRYVGSDYTPMKNPKDLYIITPAVKRDKHEWDSELALFRMHSDPELNYYNNKIVIDSWNNIRKYIEVENAWFIFDEDKICGGGAWTKAFLKITKRNDWIILSASPGDTWLDYWSVFVANGFYKNKTEFQREHVVYSRYSKFPQVERYLNTQRLMRLRDKILIDMNIQRHTKPHHEDVYCNYDVKFYKEVFKKRWDPFKDEPLKQASELCYVLRKIVNSDESRQTKLLELLEDHPKSIIFYSYDYEREILMNLGYAPGTEVKEWTGHKHEPVPTGDRWVYLVNYGSGAEGFNCISTDTIIFYSQTYSYKTLLQAIGRIDRLDTKFIDLYYYHLKSRSGIDLAISKALQEKKKFNESRWLSKWV